MATVLIDKLLEACVKQGASDIHITTGQPPVFRLHGRLRKLETKILEPEDTVALMKSIAPERCQRELQEVEVLTLDSRTRTKLVSAFRFSSNAATLRWSFARFQTR